MYFWLWGIMEDMTIGRIGEAMRRVGNEGMMWRGQKSGNRRRGGR